MTEKDLDYSRGERVWVDPQNLIALSKLGGFSESRIKAQISKVHPEEENPYDFNIGEEMAVGGEDAIIRRVVPKCDCGNEKIYHDEKGYRVCPWCDL